MRLEKYCFCEEHNVCQDCKNPPLEYEHYCRSHPACIEKNCTERSETCPNMDYKPEHCNNHRRCFVRGCYTEIGPEDYVLLCGEHEGFAYNQEGSPAYDSFFMENGYAKCKVICCYYPQSEETFFCKPHNLCKIPQCYEKLRTHGYYCIKHEEEHPHFKKFDL